MESFKIVWKRSAEKELRKLDKQSIPKIISAVEELFINPYPFGVKKLFDTENNYRIRVGDYRIVYSVFQSQLIIGHL